ncbi:hypothetical protein LCGC14_1379370 [marine sediment metagenome]|uniref:Uncharacterized protein n=1 Tax=marine sediment metagenome TaxID=412755 RepID=A0A0F9KP04_9ZZZZ
MSFDKWFDDEEDRLVEAVNNGELSSREFHREMRELRRDYSESIEAEAQAAYDSVKADYGIPQ